jgi:myo-inositol-1(or 4)-monophosphatase
MNLQELMTLASQAARRGGQVLLEWQGRFDIRHKAHNDLVTDADIAAQQAIHDFLHAHQPEFAFLGEESPQATTRRATFDQPTWIVDPLDGTTNYAHGCPAFAVSIGLEYRGELLIGVIYDPCRDELFQAGHAMGAWLGNTRLTISDGTALRHALLATGFPPNVAEHPYTLRAWEHFSVHAQSLRRTGSTALNLAYVAAGRFDGFWAHHVWPWDIAAGIVLIQEAGGLVTRLDGSPHDGYAQGIVATNGGIHEEVLAGLLASDPGATPPAAAHRL